MKPEFYVIRLGRQRDPNKMMYGQQPQAQAVPRAARNQRGMLDNFVEAAGQPVVEGAGAVYENVQGFGQELRRDELRDPVISFTTREIAEVHAKELAAKNPKVLYGVLGVLAVYETGEAPVFEKEFNNAGELVLKEQA